MAGNVEQGGSKQEQLLAFAEKIGATPEDLAGALEALQTKMRGATHELVVVANPAVQHATQPKSVNLPASVELTPEVLAACLERLKEDFKRGIVIVDEHSNTDQYRAILKIDRTARTTWNTLRARLQANKGKLLKRAARMQGGGELIGVDKSGNLIMISRADSRGNREPERFIFRADQMEESSRKPRSGEKPMLVNTDTPNREELMVEGIPANYWEIRNEVNEGGYALPPDSPDYRKEGLVAAVEAVTGKDFVRSENGNEYRSAILECGDVSMSRSSDIHIVVFDPGVGDSEVRDGYPERRVDHRGAVRVLRG